MGAGKGKAKRIKTIIAAQTVQAERPRVAYGELQAERPRVAYGELQEQRIEKKAKAGTREQRISALNVRKNYTLSSQVFVGNNTPEPDKLRVPTFGLGDIHSAKPGNGGLWTSTAYKKENDELWSDWLEWSQRPESWFHVMARLGRHTITPQPSKILIIDSVEDYENIVAAYPSRNRNDNKLFPDWPEVAKKFDACHFTTQANEGVELEARRLNDEAYPPLAWCCESTCWFKWCFEE